MERGFASRAPIARTPNNLRTEPYRDSTCKMVCPSKADKSYPIEARAVLATPVLVRPVSASGRSDAIYFFAGDDAPLPPPLPNFFHTTLSRE